MTRKLVYVFFFLSLSFLAPELLPAQILTLKQAVQTAFVKYGTIRAKSDYARASEVIVKETRRDYLPDLNLSAQQDYGTINGQNGPVYGFKGLNTASSGPPLAMQNRSAAFGALYLTNINWDFFAFGRVREKINVARSILARDQGDLEQEKFQQGVRVSAAYLNLLAAQKLTLSQQNNLDRAQALREVVVARVKNGLNPGVDSSLADAEVSNAKIALINAKEFQEEQSNQLAQLMGVPATDFVLDSLFVTRLPSALNAPPAVGLDAHPLLKYYLERVRLSDDQAKYLKTFNYPTFSLFGVLQDRGSGFDYDYGALNPNAYTGDYLKGVSFMRGNYLVGVGMVWNITSPLRIHEQVLAQQFTTQGLQEEYVLVDQQLKAELVLAGAKIRNAMDNYREAPVQVSAASEAYTQKSVLYKNGLDNIVNLTTALFTLNRAETDRDIAYNNVWQALLFKAAASGDFGLFFNEFN
jgi:outer membrane protein TolC